MPAPTCTLPLLGVENDSCDAALYPYGQQIRTLLYQDQAATAPDLRGSKTTPATLAQVQAAISAVSPNNVVVLRDVAGGLVPASSDTSLSGNDVPGGGTRLTQRTRTVTGYIYNISPTVVDAVNAHNKRHGEYRVWLGDDKNFLQGPIEHASLTFGVLERAGIGGAANRIPFTLTWLSIDEASLGFAPIPGLSSLTNS